LGQLGGDVDLREHRDRTGRNAIDRRAALRRRSARRPRSRGHAPSCTI
jgi:hypothetical protein